ncbi:MAG: dodecin family protein [Bacteroidota bacterium]|jgi:flavin-binding protein dodecin|nr:dodecin flavoprotein [Ignavibacteria bacterium]HEX2960240.1 dodecin domain-containing protein [Ignavibacteriales bacterium]MCU7497764.1 dodecin flavoprotein [Ignavibacteria bacterium]MCU7503941.1 dodecin flavoprotein [Ignavibacteria bacterium]MCU7510931.1 dodecin flavoprotein [Ignavibacteria bacterium]
MSKTFEIIEIVGVSYESSSEAVKNAVMEANKNHPVAWFHVVEERGRVTQEGKVEFQVAVKIGRKISE